MVSASLSRRASRLAGCGLFRSVGSWYSYARSYVPSCFPEAITTGPFPSKLNVMAELDRIEHIFQSSSLPLPPSYMARTSSDIGTARLSSRFFK